VFDNSDEQPLGHRYIGVGLSDIGIHDFIRCLAKRVGVTTPNYQLPKHLLMPFGVLAEWLATLSGSKKMPVLSRRTIDLLSISFSQDHIRKYNQDRWVARTSISDGLDKTFDWIAENNRDIL